MFRKLLFFLSFLVSLNSFAQDFTSIWNTANTSGGSSADNEITIPTNPIFTTYNYTVNWGDGATDTAVTGDITHTYATSGTYTIAISGDFPAIYFNDLGDRFKIIEILSWGTIEWQSMEDAFHGCSNLNFDAIDAPDLSQVTTLQYMFRDAVRFNGIINNWDVSNVTDITGMFYGASIFNRPLDSWNTSGITEMDFTFHDAELFNEPLDNWNTASVTTMESMFEDASSFNQDINNWNASNVTNMIRTFQSTRAFNRPLNNWVVNSVTDMTGMFNGSAFNQPIGNWVVDNVTNMSEMFSSASFNQPIGDWNVSSVTNMSEMFERNAVFNQPLNNWTVDNVTDVRSMFDGGCTSLTAPLADTVNLVDLAEITWDAVADATQYRITVDGSSSDLNDVTDLLVTGTSHAFTNNFDNGETVTVTIVPLNGNTEPATTCNSEIFTIEAAAPPPANCTTLLRPTNNAINVPINTGIEWEPVSGALGYRISVTNMDTGIPIQNNGAPITNLDVGEITLFNFDADLPADTEISVLITPYFNDGDVMGCLAESFTTDATISPTECTSLSSPQNNDIDVPIDLATISWNPANAADSYIISISSTSGANNLPATDLGDVLFYTLPEVFALGDIVTVSILPRNSLGEVIGGCPPPENFTITTVVDNPTPPECTILTTPLDMDVDVAVDTLLSWISVENVDGYRLMVRTDIATIFNDDVGNVTNFQLPNNLPESTEIFVTIVPYIGSVNAESCIEESFITESAIINTLPCTNLTSPANGSSNIILTPTLNWNAIGNVDGYIINIGTSPGTNDILDLNVGLTTSFELTEDLPFGTEVFVTIIPFNALGQPEGCQSQSFTTISETEEEVESLFGLSPDGDGINEFWEINGIEAYPENTVFIFNRWGDMVFRIEGYNNSSNVFRGEANQLQGIGANQLPEGTYFFQINIPEENNLKATKGFLVLKR